MNDNFYSVSRIECGKVVLEFPNGEFHEVTSNLLPNDVKEGNILIISDDGTFIHDYALEKERKEKILKLQNDIFG